MMKYKCIESFDVETVSNASGIGVGTNIAVEVGTIWELVEEGFGYYVSTDEHNVYELELDEITIQENFEVFEEKIIVWAYENKKEKGRYLSDGPEFADYEHERGDVTDLVDALLVWMRSGEEVTDYALSGFEKQMQKMNFYDWSKDIRPFYKPVKIEVNKSLVDEMENR